MIQITKKDGYEKTTYFLQINDDLPFGYELDRKQLEELYLEISQHLFDNLLEQNKDLLRRLRDNETAPRKLDSDKVIAWLHDRIQVGEPAIVYDDEGQPLADSFLAHAEARTKAADAVVEQFKKDFDL